MNANVHRAVKDFVRLFQAKLLPNAVLGGLAARALGVPRPTWDVDFTVAVDREDLGSLFEQAEELGYTVPSAYQAVWVNTVSGMPFVKLGISIGDRSIDVDVFLAETDCLAEVIRRASTELLDDDFRIQVVSPEDLIVLKCVSFRPRDVIDIQDVLFMQGELDRDYMRHWADQLGVRRNLEESLRKYDASPEERG
ncbi:MAG: nucleotidyl transferase AbiEii/AbiGii toxin family protein [Planctomycetaceae bacterium]|nr:nucleotidyl transferase AbiEii/AbiGii toxin family protein [Planctomycetaceae bacterium]